jgi:putative copper resistance protein D
VTSLTGFLNVVLQGLALIGLATAVGGVAFALIILRPFDPPSRLGEAARRRCLALVTGGALLLAGAQAVILGLQPLALADPGGSLPLGEFFRTTFARVGLGRIGLGALLSVAAALARRSPSSRGAWGALALLALLVGGNSAWLSHALGRLEHREALIALTGFHQILAAVWVGGLIHLVAFSLLRRLPAEDAEAARVVTRFSPLALGAIAGLVAAGIALSTFYLDGLDALLGTGYGVMILTKVVVLGGALVLAALNRAIVRRLARRGGAAPGRLWWFVEAEVGLALTLLLAAAALTSLPPGADVREDRATPAEVAARFVPKAPRLTSPPIADLLATAAPIADVLAERKPVEYAWSEYNHHVAGLFVLSMGLLALAEGSGRRWARHWPLLFLGLAAFLFVRNDPRAWPLGPAGFWESMLLPDVLQHRLAVLLVVALACVEWGVRTGRLAPRWAYVFPVLGAAGGALLLTHSHALFNLKQEFLLEVTHAPLGVLAVFVGWARWLELRMPAPERRIPGRVWASSMALIGLVLLFYREL